MKSNNVAMKLNNVAMKSNNIAIKSMKPRGGLFGSHLKSYTLLTF